LVWTLGATLLTHVISYIAVSYIYQIVVLWFMLLTIKPNLAGQTWNNLSDQGMHTEVFA
jgi:hypothetical protein